MALETITLKAIKRGQTFSYTAKCPGAQLEEFTSQVNTASGSKMDDVEIEPTDDPDTFRFVVRDTSGWETGILRTDIKRKVNGETAYSLTMLIPVERSETP